MKEVKEEAKVAQKEAEIKKSMEKAADAELKKSDKDE